MSEKDDGTTPKSAKAAIGNGLDPDVLKAVVEECETIAAEVATKKGEFGAFAKKKNAEITDAIGNAKEQYGIPKKMMKDVLKERALDRQIEALRESKEPEDRDIYDDIRHKLGMLEDTPLGQAALAADASNVSALNVMSNKA